MKREIVGAEKVAHPRYWSYNHDACIENGKIIHSKLDIQYFLTKRLHWYVQKHFGVLDYEQQL